MSDLQTHLSVKARKRWTLLLPYWGLKSDPHTSRPLAGIRNQSSIVTGLSTLEFQELSHLLAHTGLHISEQADGRNPLFTIEVKDHTPSPLSIITETATFHLKPLQKNTREVQKRVHKHLWLPESHKQYTIIIHKSERAHLPEWMCYLIIQFYMRTSLCSLSALSFSDYKIAVQMILKNINAKLAAYQLTPPTDMSAEWPEFPPMPKWKNHTHPMHAFKKQEKPPIRKTLNPFRKK